MKQANAVTFADLLPPLSSEEFEALRADIEANGVQQKVVVDEDGEVLDGRHRLQIKPDAPRTVKRGLTPGEKEAFVFRSNFMRRNLSPDQKHEVRQRMKVTAEILRAEDAKKWTQAAVAKELGVSQQCVDAWFNRPPTTNGKQKTRSNTTSGKGSKPRPDARVKVSAAQKEEIAERVATGESQAQVAADYKVSQRTVSSVTSKAKKKTEQKKQHAKAAEKFKETQGGGVIHGDFREKSRTIPADSVALVFTDPPYHRKHLELYDGLGKMAARVLVDGGSLITYCGHYLLPEVIQSLSKHLRYFWICACVHSGGVAEMREYGVKVKWKPLLWFVKGTFRRNREDWIEDAVASSEEKSHHEWQQSVLDAAHFIDTLTAPGEVVIDPFCGGGTTALAAKQAGRLWLTYDIDRGHCQSAQERLA